MMEPVHPLARKAAALEELGFREVASADLPSESVPVGGHRYKVTCRRPSMGTLVSVTLIHESRGMAEEAAALAFQEMDRVVDLLNRYDPRSPLAHLNLEGTIKRPPPELREVLWRARFFHDVSAGAFDVTVQPLVDLLRQRALEGKAGDAAGLPEGPLGSELREVASRVNGSKVAMDRKEIRLGLPGMGVTLDGIAKGFVVDCMAAILRERGLANYLVDAGGDIRSEGCREDGRPWRVGVQDPQKSGDLPDIIALRDGAVATSGSYEVYFDPERTYHHVVSPVSGRSPSVIQSVSVVAPTTLAADALATTVFVMEPRQGAAFIDSFPDCACLIVDHRGRQLRSRGWRSIADIPT